MKHPEFEETLFLVAELCKDVWNAGGGGAELGGEAPGCQSAVGPAGGKTF
jgi:hypothetical protein